MPSKNFVSSRTTLFRRRLSLLAAGTALAVSSIASAECQGSACSSVYVEEVYPEVAGGAWIRTSGTETSLNCTADSGQFLRLPAGSGFQAVYATLLAAQLANKKVTIRTADGSNPCTIVWVALNQTNW